MINVKQNYNVYLFFFFPGGGVFGALKYTGKIWEKEKDPEVRFNPDPVNWTVKKSSCLKGPDQNKDDAMGQKEDK